MRYLLLALLALTFAPGAHAQSESTGSATIQMSAKIWPAGSGMQPGAHGTCTIFTRGIPPGITDLGTYDGYSLGGVTITGTTVLTVQKQNFQYAAITLSPSSVPMRGPGSLAHAQVTSDCSDCDRLGQQAQTFHTCSCDVDWSITQPQFSVVEAGTYTGETDASIMCSN